MDGTASLASAGRDLLAARGTPAEVAARLAAAARAVTGAPYAVVTLSGPEPGAGPVADPPGAAAGAGAATVAFDGGTLAAEGDAGALAVLAAFAEPALRRAREAEWRRAANDLLRHDTRTWLGIGQGYVAMLGQHLVALTPEQREVALRGLVDAFGKLDVFTRTVLVDEQLEVGTGLPRAGDVTVAALVGPLRAAFPDLVVEGDTGVLACLDSTLVQAALEHLVRNAREAGPPVTLVVRAEGGGVRFEVRDRGPGVPEEERAAIWQRYVRTARSRAGRAPGLGLGLAIVRRVAEVHGGTYGIRDEGGETVCWLALPGRPGV